MDTEKQNKKLFYIGLCCLVLLFSLLNAQFVSAQTTNSAIDTDSDGVIDIRDNCTEVANPDQRDTNQDGFGNICDPDLNDDNIVDANDAVLWSWAVIDFFAGKYNPDADFNGDGQINNDDLYIYADRFGLPPGPSGLSSDRSVLGFNLIDEHVFASPSDTRESKVADINNDGYVDYISGGRSISSNVYILPGTGPGRFSDTRVAVDRVTTFDINIGDINGDGRLDIINGNDGYYRNDGNYSFTHVLNSAALRSGAQALGDVDNDGDLDMARGLYSDPSQILFNQGGTFYDSGQLLGDIYTWRTYFVDVDNDGDLDLFEGRVNNNGHVYLNDGNGYFSHSAGNIDSTQFREAAFGDVNGDGNMDIAIARYVGDILRNCPDPRNPRTCTVVGYLGTPNSIYFGNGQGQFTDSGQQIGDAESWSVALGDLDLDGDLDLVDAHLGGDIGKNTIWLNDGLGNFSDSGIEFPDDYTYKIHLIDFDGDQDLDMIWSTRDSVKVWENTLKY